MAFPPPLACSVEGCHWTTPPNVPTWELITTLMGQHTQAVHPAGGQGGCGIGFEWKWITRLMGQHTQADHPGGEQGANGGGEQDTGIIEVNNRREMDQSSVEKIKLTKFGLKYNLIGFSSFLSIFGIVVSTLGAILGLSSLSIGIGATTDCRELACAFGPFLIIIGVIILVITIPYLAMWIVLNKNTHKRDIASIEKIGKIYSYVSGALEIIAMGGCLYQFGFTPEDLRFSYGQNIFILLFATTDIIFTCLRIYGIMLEKNKLLGIYLGYRYAAFILTILFSIISASYSPGIWIGYLICQVLFFIPDIGLIVILHSIREDRGKQSQPETFALSLHPMPMQQQMQHEQPPPHQQVAYNPQFNPSAPMLPDSTPSLGHIQQPVDYMNWGAPNNVQMPAVHGDIVPEESKKQENPMCY